MVLRYRCGSEDGRCGSALAPSRLLRREDLTSSLWQFRIASISQSLLAFVGPLLVIREGNGLCATGPHVLTCCPESRGCWQSDECLRLNIPPSENLCRNVSLHPSGSLKASRQLMPTVTTGPQGTRTARPATKH